MEKTCRNCGANNEANAEFCFLCGTKLDDSGAGPEKSVRENKFFRKRGAGKEAPADPGFGGPGHADNAFPGDGTADALGFSFGGKAEADPDPLFPGDGGGPSASPELGFGERTDTDPLFPGDGGAPSAPADLGFGERADTDPLFSGGGPSAPPDFGYGERTDNEPVFTGRDGGSSASAGGFGGEVRDDRALPFDDLKAEAPAGFGFDEPGVGFSQPFVEPTVRLNRGNDPSGGAGVCPHCGHPVQTDDSYCLNCGGFLGAAADWEKGKNAKEKPAAGETAPPMEPLMATEDDWLDSDVPSGRKKNGGVAPVGASRIVIPIVAALLSVCVTLALLIFVFHIDIPGVSRLFDKKTEAAVGGSVSGSVSQEDTGFTETVTQSAAEETPTVAEPDTAQDTEPVTDVTELAQAVPALSLVKGETVLFGSYPQWKVTDPDLIDRLDRAAQGAAWHSYDYTDGNGQIGSQRLSDNMRYVDVTDGDARYRGVYISDYRPYWSYISSGSENSEQDDNGYYAGTTYWFRYDPISWIVLDTDAGLLLSEYALDAQPHTQEIFKSGDEYYLNSSCTYYACNYEKSYIREWLNGSFFETAFSYNEAARIKSGTWNNENANSEFRKYSGSSTVDRVALLSYDDATDSSFGFSANAETRDSFRAAYGTDYAKCQGMLVASNGSCSNLQLRSPGCGSDYCVGITSEGVVYEDGKVESARVGVRPVLFYLP